MRLFNYTRKTHDLGQGTMPLGLMRPQTVPREGIYDPSRNVRRPLAVVAPGYAKFTQLVPDASLSGFNGTFLTGQFAYAHLAEINRNRRGQ